MDSGTRRITNTWLIGEGGSASRGDFLLHSDGSVSDSKGDEDVIETIDGKNRLITIAELAHASRDDSQSRNGRGFASYGVVGNSDISRREKTHE